MVSGVSGAVVSVGAVVGSVGSARADTGSADSISTRLNAKAIHFFSIPHLLLRKYFFAYTEYHIIIFCNNQDNLA